MIVKFYDNDSIIMFGEVFHLEHVEIKKDGEQVTEKSGTLKYRQGNCPVKGKYMALSLFRANMTEPIRVECYSPIYLMNDNGKTIEII